MDLAAKMVRPFALESKRLLPPRTAAGCGLLGGIASLALHSPQTPDRHPNIYPVGGLGKQMCSTPYNETCPSRTCIGLVFIPQVDFGWLEYLVFRDTKIEIFWDNYLDFSQIMW